MEFDRETISIDDIADAEDFHEEGVLFWDEEGVACYRVYLKFLTDANLFGRSIFNSKIGVYGDNFWFRKFFIILPK